MAFHDVRNMTPPPSPYCRADDVSTSPAAAAAPAPTTLVRASAIPLLPFPYPFPLQAPLLVALVHCRRCSQIVMFVTLGMVLFMCGALWPMPAWVWRDVRSFFVVISFCSHDTRCTVGMSRAELATRCVCYIACGTIASSTGWDDGVQTKAARSVTLQAFLRQHCHMNMKCCSWPVWRRQIMAGLCICGCRGSRRLWRHLSYAAFPV